MSKKLLYNLLAALMLASLVLTACGAGAPAATEAPAEEKLLVGISMPTQS